MEMVSWVQIVQAISALAIAGTVVFLINRASRKRYEQQQRQEKDT
jgi:hypothetical protein